MHNIATTAALEILGYEHVYHGWTTFDDPGGRRKLTQGMRAKFQGRGKPLTRADFDWIFGQYSATGGDMPSVAFGDELIAAYPEAKVIIVERDAESWIKSFPSGVDPCFRFFNKWILGVLDPVFMGSVCEYWQTAFKGVFRAKTCDEVKKNGLVVYKEWYQHVRDVTPKERLLDMNLKDGWGPLCEFLGKPIPDQSFPHLNEKSIIEKREKGYQMRTLGNIGKNIVLLGTVGAIAWWLLKHGSAAAGSEL